jgi:hypothetical protein
VQYGAGTWHDLVRKESGKNKGKIAKVYKLMLTFTGDDVTTFLNAFADVEPTKKLLTDGVKNVLDKNLS